MIEVKEVKGVIEVNDDTLLPAKHLSITSRTSITSSAAITSTQKGTRATSCTGSFL